MRDNDVGLWDYGTVLWDRWVEGPVGCGTTVLGSGTSGLWDWVVGLAELV